MKNWNDIEKELRLAGATKVILREPETLALPKILHQEEEIMAFVSGTYEGGIGMLVATNQRMVFVDKKPFKLLVDEVPYSMIASIEYKIGTITGTVQVFARSKNFELRLIRKRWVRPFVTVVEEFMARIAGVDH